MAQGLRGHYAFRGPRFGTQYPHVIFLQDGYCFIHYAITLSHFRNPLIFLQERYQLS